MKITKKLKKGFSITESIVSLTLIILISFIALSATALSTTIQQDNFINLDIYNSSEGLISSFNNSYAKFGKSENEKNKEEFIDNFNKEILNYFNLSFIADPEIDFNIDGIYLSCIEFKDENIKLKSFSYSYKYNDNQYYINAKINIRTNIYYFDLEAFKKKSKKIAYRFTEEL